MLQAKESTMSKVGSVENSIAVPELETLIAPNGVADAAQGPFCLGIAIGIIIGTRNIK